MTRPRNIGARMALVGLVALGMVAQTGAHLLSFTTPSTAPVRNTDALSEFSEPGPHPVGVRNLPHEPGSPGMTVWHPATSTDEADHVTYAYGVRLFSADTETAVASYVGRAALGAPFDGVAHPLVVLSHGFALTPGSYGWLAEHVASHGMVVVAPDHAETLDPSRLWSATIERPGLIAAVLADLEARSAPGGELEGVIDISTVAVVGHSYGGYTALAAGGAQLDLASFHASCSQARVDDDPLTFLCDALEPRAVEIEAAVTPTPPAADVDAVVSIAGDTAMFGEAGLSELSAPVMVIGGTADTDTPYEWGPGLTFAHGGSRRKVEVALEGAGHLVFAGRCDATRRLLMLAVLGFCSDPSWERDAAQAVVKHYVAAFLRSELLADPASTETLGRDRLAIGGIEYNSEGF